MKNIKGYFKMVIVFYLEHISSTKTENEKKIFASVIWS